MHAMTTATPARRAGPDRRAWSVLGILCFVYVLNFLDRQLLSILAKPIQDDLGVTDGQLGLISGLYFALFYCVLAIPVGWLADRTNRVRVLSLACALWSAATMACGMAANYPQLVDRAHVGGRGRGGRRAAVLRHHLATTFRRARAARRSASTTSGRRSGRRWASPSVRRSRRPTAGARPSCRSARWASSPRCSCWLFVREPVRGGLDAPRAGAQPATAARRRSGRPAACSSRDPVLLRVSLASGVTQFVTYAHRSTSPRCS